MPLALSLSLPFIDNRISASERTNDLSDRQRARKKLFLIAVISQRKWVSKCCLNNKWRLSSMQNWSTDIRNMSKPSANESLKVKTERMSVRYSPHWFFISLVEFCWFQAKPTQRLRLRMTEKQFVEGQKYIRSKSNFLRHCSSRTMFLVRLL